MAQKSIFVEAFEELADVFRHKGLFLPLVGLTLIYTLLVYFVFIWILDEYLSYFALGALIIKTIGLQDISNLLPYVLAAPITTLISFLSPGMLYVYFAFSAVKKKLGRKISKLDHPENTRTSFMFFISFFFVIAILFAVFSPLIFFSSLLYSVVCGALFYVLFFVPYSLAIDDYSYLQALKKGFEIFGRKPLDPLIWSFVLGIILSVVFLIIEFLSMVLWPQGALLLDRIMLNELLMFLVNQIFIIPYGIMVASYMYVRRYPLVK